MGFIFHRQKPVSGYIADFYCAEASLVIEADGEYHKSAEAADNDKARDEAMHNLGITVLRFKNIEVLNNTDKVVKTIDDILLGMI